MSNLNFEDSIGIRFRYNNGKLTIDATHLAKGVSLYYDSEIADKWEFLQKNTEDVIIKGNIIDMPYSVFHNFEKLTNLRLPDSLESIGDFDFYGCTKLEGIKIPAKTEIRGPENNYFHSIEVDKDNPYYTSKNGCLMSKDGKKLVVAPGGLDELIIPEECEEIGKESICMTYNRIVIPSSVHSIDELNFYGEYGTIVLGDYDKQYELIKKCFTRDDSLKEESLIRFEKINMIDIDASSIVAAVPVRDASYYRDLEELKKRGFGAIVRNKNVGDGFEEYGFITSMNLIESVDNGAPIIIKDIEDREVSDLIFDYDASGRELVTYPTLEDMLDDGWRLD